MSPRIDRSRRRLQIGGQAPDGRDRPASARPSFPGGRRAQQQLARPGPDQLPGRRRSTAGPHAGRTRQGPIQARPALGVDLGVAGRGDLVARSAAQAPGWPGPGPARAGRGPVVAGDHQVVAVLGAPTHQDVDVWVVGIPVVDQPPSPGGCPGPSRPGPSARGCRRAGRPARRASSGETMNRKWWRSPSQRSAKASTSAASPRASNMWAGVAVAGDPLALADRRCVGPSGAAR
jgi:hypothetical protein